MSEQPATPDPVELTRRFYETMDRDWDFDPLAGFSASDAVWDRVQARHLQVFEWVQGGNGRTTGYPDIDEARAAAERLAQERADG